MMDLYLVRFEPLIREKTVERKASDAIRGEYSITSEVEEVDLHSPAEVREYFKAAFPRPEFVCCYVEGDPICMIGRPVVNTIVWTIPAENCPRQFVAWD
jgi:hypothetical protein